MSPVSLLFHRFVAAVSGLLGLHDVALSGLSQQAATRLRRMQIRGAIAQMRVFVVGNTFFAPVLSFQAWNTGINVVVIGWTVAMLVFSWWLFWTWLTTDETDGRKAHMDRFILETKVNASLWCLGMVLFYPYVEGDAKAIVTTVMAGSLALGTVGFSQAPLAAFWFLGIQAVTLTVVPLYHGINGGSSSDFVISFLALLASGAIFNATLERAKAQMRAFRDNEALAQKNEVVDLLLKDYEEQGAEWIWRTDAQGRLVSCPKQIVDLLGVTDAVAKQTQILDLLQAAIREDDVADFEKAARAMQSQTDFHDVTLPLVDRQRDVVRWINMRGRPQFDGETFIGYRGIFADATATVEAKRKVHFLAEHDPLTGIYNRNLVQKKLQMLDPQTDTALVYLIDLDGFKQVNDSYGHLIGDELLKVMAQRIRQTVGKDGLVARLGGDEFFVLIRPVENRMYAAFQALSAELIDILSDPCVIAQYDIAVSASIGTARFPVDTDDGVSLLNLADLALYAAKQGGRDRCVPFARHMQAGLQRRRFITERLRLALEDDCIHPVYQPQYCAQSGKLIGFEALARWSDRELGVVSPDVFIPIAEETGLIHELGASLMRKACTDLLPYTSINGGEAPSVAVNLSALQITRGNTIEMVQDILHETGFPAERLELEMTESVLIEDLEGTRRLLKKLSAIGISVALDDFGTGYSSLSYVSKLPLDKIKIDRSFIMAMPEPEALSIIETIIDMCKKLNIHVVAEGVETQRNVDDLSALGCDVLQGYFFQKPMTADELSVFMQAPALSA